jgi:hypothetical protein
VRSPYHATLMIQMHLGRYAITSSASTEHNYLKGGRKGHKNTQSIIVQEARTAQQWARLTAVSPDLAHETHSTARSLCRLCPASSR